MKDIVAYVDGGANNRTKSGGYGSYAVFGEDELIHAETFLLPAKTSNQAEYMSLIELLKFTKKHRNGNGRSKWTIYCDSRLTVFQVTNGWKVNEPTLKELNKIAKELLTPMKKDVRIIWTPRKNILKVLGH
jgi:ribonuclease HI